MFTNLEKHRECASAGSELFIHGEYFVFSAHIEVKL
jgi:hypothetical protein